MDSGERGVVMGLLRLRPRPATQPTAPARELEPERRSEPEQEAAAVREPVREPEPPTREPERADPGPVVPVPAVQPVRPSTPAGWAATGN